MEGSAYSRMLKNQDQRKLEAKQSGSAYYRMLVKQDQRKLKAQQDASANLLVHLNVMPIFTLTTGVTVQKLKHFYKLRIDRFRMIQSLSLHNTPVTPPYTSQHSYHIVALIDSSRPNTQVQFLIQEADGYVAAVRVVSKREERSTTRPWYAFSGMVIPAHIPSIMTQYSSSYSEIEKAQVGDNIFQRIYKFYHRFNDPNFVNLPTDPLSDVYSQSLFVLLGEGQRFGVARRFIFLHLANPKVEHPSALMTILFRNWSSFSKACLCQYLADLEAKLGMNNDETKRQAMTMWRGLKRRFGQLVNFGDGGQESILSALLEDELYMLKSDDDREKLFIKVMMRLGGHNDQFVIPW